MIKVKRAVLRITPSPLNPQQWCVELECGHDFWKTSKRKPTVREAPCARCTVAAAPEPKEK